MNNDENSEDLGRNRLTTSISWRPEDLEVAKKAASEKGLSLSAWIRQLMLSSDDFKRVKEHANKMFDDRQYLSAARQKATEFYGLSSWGEVVKLINKPDREQVVQQAISMLMSAEFQEINNLLKRAEQSSSSPGIRISPTPAGDQDLSVLDEKPSLDVPDDDGEEDGQDRGRKKA